MRMIPDDVYENLRLKFFKSVGPNGETIWQFRPNPTSCPNNTREEAKTNLNSIIPACSLPSSETIASSHLVNLPVLERAMPHEPHIHAKGSSPLKSEILKNRLKHLSLLRALTTLNLALKTTLTLKTN